MSYFNKLTVFFLLIVVILPQVKATPSGGSFPPSFHFKSGQWYDDWGLTRDSADGRYGYIPQLSAETLGENRELAYRIGVRFRNTYSDRISMAAAILKYVQTWTVYGYDSDNVKMRGVAQDEWAWNADEMAHMFNETTGEVAVGDCEDMAFLCFTLYTGAGIEAAIVDAPGHVALLIWLPDYPNASMYWDLPEDDQGAGWIWVEATGSNNPLGWMPSDFSDGEWTAYTFNGGEYFPQQPVQTSSDSVDMDLIILVIIVLFIVISKIFRR